MQCGFKLQKEAGAYCTHDKGLSVYGELLVTCVRLTDKTHTDKFPWIEIHIRLHLMVVYMV